MKGDAQGASGSGASARRQGALKSGSIVALGLLVLVLYVSVFRPMTDEVVRLDASLDRTYREITETGLGYPENPGEYLDNAKRELERMRQLSRDLAERTTFHPEMDELLQSPFRVLEYEQRRFDIQQGLKQLAAEHGSRLPADLLGGLPAYSQTNEPPQQLWLHLEFFNHVLQALLSSGRGLRVERIESLPIEAIGSGPEAGESLLKLQLRLQVGGSVSALAAFLNASLPGGREADSPAVGKAYSIERLDFRSDANRGAGEVVLDAMLSGFILYDQAD
jgi:hypothetical protein